MSIHQIGEMGYLLIVICIHLALSLPATCGQTYPVGRLNQLQQEVTMVKTLNGDCEWFRDQHDEKCKYYGSCCEDPMRLREKLARGTFRCMTLNTTHEIKS